MMDREDAIAGLTEWREDLETHLSRQYVENNRFFKALELAIAALEEQEEWELWPMCPKCGHTFKVEARYRVKKEG